MLNRIKDNIFGFLHGHSIELVVKGVLAWYTRPDVAQSVTTILNSVHLSPSLLQSQVFSFLVTLWGVDRVHQLYKDAGAAEPTPSKPAA